MSTTPQANTPAAATSAGRKVDLASYQIAGLERTIRGQRIDGIVILTDEPTRGDGPSYQIESGLEKDGYSALKALVTDYLAQAVKHLTIPMAASPIDRYLTEIER